MCPPRSIATAPADEIARAIHARRMGLDWSLAKLAQASGLRSPAYVFHIENGTRTPSPAVARRIAAALGLDPELFAAWSLARGRADLPSALAASERLRRWLERTGEGADAGGAPPAAVAVHDEGPVPHAGAPAEVERTYTVPILPEGAPTDAEPIESLRLDRALFPPLEPHARLVGYRLSAHGARRVPDLLRAGDCAVVLLGAERPGPDMPCAVRAGTRVELARAPADAAANLPPHGGTADSGPTGSRTRPLEVVGRVVLIFRRWL